MTYKKDVDKAGEQWARYVFCRDNGHTRFVDKAVKCDDFFAGLQWKEDDILSLNAQRRPALTINKILSTLSTVMGMQIQNRSEVTFLPQRGGSGAIADALVKVWQHIAYNNQLQWLRADVFCDGLITSRGFYDVRLDFNDAMQGEVRITKPNPKNVVLDPDGEEYDPDTWGDVITTKWVTADDIAVLYDGEAAEELRTRTTSIFQYGYDSIDRVRDRFGGQHLVDASFRAGGDPMRRHIRLIDRQYKKLVKSVFLVDPDTGDMRRAPDGWKRDKIVAMKERFGLGVVEKWERRPYWCVTAEDLVLFEDWSPYRRFTTIPYFPYFRHGRTIGLVENLIGPQELLNKTTSQELHVINTTANSGWKIKTGALSNMSVEELEERGAQTGIVLELDDVDSAEKIQPNQIPTGLERISFKAEEYIKGISNVSDSMQGFDREDVAAKAIQQKRQSAGMNFSKMLDNLERTDYFLARAVLDLVQEYYTEPRLLNIITDPLLGEMDSVSINEVDQATGAITNDLTLGEYQIIVTTAPYRASVEDSQFEQATALRELGVPIPDSVLIENSRLLRKREIVKQLEAASQSPEAQMQQQLQLRGMAAEVGLKEAQTQKTLADAGAKADSSAINAAKVMMTPGQDPELEREKADREFALEVQKQDRDFALKTREMQMQEQLDADAHAREQARQDEQTRNDGILKRAQAVAAAKAPAQQQPAAQTPKSKP